MAKANFLPTHPRFKNLIGQRFVKLIVVAYHGKASRGGGALWRCRCDCGNETIVHTRSLNCGQTKSCGCLRHAPSKQRIPGVTINGKLTVEYRAWSTMIQRCTNPKNHKYADYGGRGIVVCDRWLTSFSNFLADVGERPSKYHSLDRFPNNNGPYSPGNIRWATASEQCRNRRSNRLITYQGRTQTMEAWVIETGINQTTLHGRLRRGWPPEEALGFAPHTNLARKLTDAERRQRIRTRTNLNKAIRMGKIPRASTLRCICCGEWAVSYHHFAGYSFECRFMVVPMCNVCHGKR